MEPPPSEWALVRPEPLATVRQLLVPFVLARLSTQTTRMQTPRESETISLSQTFKLPPVMQLPGSPGSTKSVVEFYPVTRQPWHQAQSAPLLTPSEWECTLTRTKYLELKRLVLLIPPRTRWMLTGWRDLATMVSILPIGKILADVSHVNWIFLGCSYPSDYNNC